MTDRPTTEAGLGDFEDYHLASCSGERCECGVDAAISRVEAQARAALIDELVAAVEGLPVHSINGYEWECEECHYHFARHPCRHTGVEATDDGYVDSREEPTDHGALLDRTAVLRLLEGARHGE